MSNALPTFWYAVVTRSRLQDRLFASKNAGLYRVSMRSVLPIVLFLMFAAGANAQEEESNLSFSEAWGRYEYAKAYGGRANTLAAAKHVLDVAQQTLPQWDVRFPKLLDNYGLALMDTGETELARDVLEQAVASAEEIHGKDAEESIPILMHYADSRAEFSNSRSQEKFYKQALKIGGKIYGKDSNDYADIALTAGYRILDLSRTTSGAKYLKTAHKIFVARQGVNSHAAASASFYLGKTSIATGHYKSAVKSLLAALAGFESVGESSLESELITRAFLVQAYESLEMSDAATEHCVAIGARNMLRPDQEMAPLFRLAPDFPSQLYSAREGGYVELAFTVDENGFVQDPVAIDRQGSVAFERSAIKAVKRFRFAPRFRDGEPVAVENVKTRFSFEY